MSCPKVRFYSNCSDQPCCVQEALSRYSLVISFTVFHMVIVALQSLRLQSDELPQQSNKRKGGESMNECTIGDPLWSARLLHTNPQAIGDAHYSFLLSGADVITTATYQASVTGFVTHMDVSAERARELLSSGVQLAQESVKRFVSDTHPTEQRRPLVAGSVGPYGAFLHDGSEYTGAYAEEMSIEELKVWHRSQIDCLAAAGADLIAIETIPSVKEAEALVELLREFPNSKAWLSFSCKDGRCISDGSLFADAVQIANRSTQLVAVGVNCCSPAFVEPLLDSARSLLSPDMSWVVYPNSGEEWDAEQGWLLPYRPRSRYRVTTTVKRKWNLCSLRSVTVAQL
ncbi:hypothetical protein F2P81_006137 [Scophthalmus maximus]|uniref:Hcy-binding domain-containing protein n=1 Tax=Scophthalmus maximus TaxID=52904 RepID=A0A6A4TBI7_SCOMX|nr:hypothetical protein F2P81_006137 [Scophthalmus maximus]